MLVTGELEAQRAVGRTGGDGSAQYSGQIGGGDVAGLFGVNATTPCACVGGVFFEGGAPELACSIWGSMLGFEMGPCAE